MQIDPDLGRLPGDLEISLFRVVQECLTNVYRHSGSDFCSISLRRDGQFVYLEIRDAGRGIQSGTSEEKPVAGVGLRGMRERLRPLGGTLHVHSTNQGTAVNVVVPVPEGSESQRAG